MIYGDRLRFRFVEHEDLSLFVGWLNDPEVRAGLALFLPMSMALEEKWFENMLKRPQEEQPLVIELKQGRKWLPIGNCGFHNLDWRSRQAEVGILIGEKKSWGKGYGTEAMRMLLRHGFETLNLNRLYLQVYENNPRAIRSYEKVGFSLEGRMRQAHYQDGAYRDVLLMSVLRSEWEQNEA